jgi:S-adenosylmethionine/arginine decarboxylase-like enzyme
MLVHKHLIIRTEVLNPPGTDTEWVVDWLSDLVSKIGMKVLSGPYSEYVHVEGNKGATGIVIIETSHIAIHVWDEPDPALIQLDVYTCGPFDPHIVFDHIQQFNPVKMEYKYLDREHGLIEVDCEPYTKT